MRARLAKIDLIAIDDLGLAPLTTPERHDLLEVLEVRTEWASTLITSQCLRVFAPGRTISTGGYGDTPQASQRALVRSRR